MPVAMEYQTRELWAADARVGSPHYTIGSSAVPAILGLSPWQTPFEAWLRLTGQSHDQPENEAMRRGNLWEPVIAGFYAQRREIHVDTRLRRVWSDKAKWLGVSPDGLVGSDGILEVKTSMSEDGWGADGDVIVDARTETGIVPPVYVLQGLAQLEATRRDWVDFIVGIPDRVEILDLRVIRMFAQPDLQRAMVAAVERWRAKHLIEGRPPEIDGSGGCSAWLGALSRTPTSRPCTPDECDMLDEFIDLRERFKSMEERLDLLKNRLMHAAGEHKTIFAPAGRMTVVSVAGRQSVSWSKIKDQRPDLAEQLSLAGLVASGKPSAYPKITKAKEAHE